MTEAYRIIQQQRRAEEQASEIEAIVREIWSDCFLPEWPAEIEAGETTMEDTNSGNCE
jgi:hypothetical protein